MNLLILSIFGDRAGELLIEDSLVNLRRLMEMGAYGTVEMSGLDASSPSSQYLEVDSWKAFAKTGKPGLWFTASPFEVFQSPMGKILVTDWMSSEPSEICRGQFQSTSSWMLSEPWGVCLIEDHGLRYIKDHQGAKEYFRVLDQGLGSLFEMLTDDTFVAVFLRPVDLLSGFILAAPFVEPAGEVTHASMNDVAFTLLRLIGLIPLEPALGKMILKSIDEGEQPEFGLSQDEEAILRERLSGLGYL